MDDSLNHKIFAETDCISEQTLFDYIDKKLSAKECHAVERHLLHCELCSDALDGLEMLKDRSRINIINQKINERIVTPLKEEKVVNFNRFNYKAIISIAASVLLLIGGIFFFNMLNRKDEMAEFKSSADNAKTTESTNGSLAKEIPKEETDNKSQIHQGSDNQTKQEQVPLAGEEKESESDYKTVFDEDKASAGSGIVSRNAIAQGEVAEKNVQEELSEAQPIISDEELPQRAKDSDDQETRRQDAATGGTLNKDKPVTAFSAPSVSIPVSEKQLEGATERDESGDNFAKKSKKENDVKEFSRSNTRKRDAAEKEEKPAAIAYAPQNIAANTEDINLETASVTSTLEQNPEYPGGQDSLLSFIQTRFDASLLQKNEPVAAQMVQVQLTVGKKGDVKKIKIVKGINEEMDKELLRVLTLMPKWKPGTSNGEAVSKQVILPIRLK